MKKFLISTVTVTMVLLIAFPAPAQQETRERSRIGETAGVLSAEEKEKLREKWTTMSKEEKEEFRKKIRDRMAAQRPAMGPETPLRMSDRYEQQINRMKAEHEEFIGELKTVREVALKEKARKTVEQLDMLIEKHQKKFDDSLSQLTQRRERLERMQREQPGTTQRERPEKQQAGRPAPPFTLSTFDGKTVRLSDYMGKTVVLEWLNFECPFSLHHYKTVKTMVDLANKYKPNNVVWLAINSTSHTTPEANKKFSEEYKLPFPILDDRSGRVGRLYDAQTTPHMYIINPRGGIVYEGAIDNAPLGKTAAGQEPVNYVDKALAELTTNKAVSNMKTKPYGCTVKYPQ